MDVYSAPVNQTTADSTGNEPVAGVSSRQLIHGTYFPHIDGIRTLAVLPVVLFHIFPWFCPGGFSGVDVFFVISGYLITGNILRDLEKGCFTIRGFYHRRIRRIFPANFALLAGVFVTGCIIYYSVPLKRLGDTIVASTLFSANLFFWNNVGDYFAPEVHQNALLNLWSLSVEEQFYLFIPLLCAVVFNFRRGLVVPVLVALGILSFSASIYAVTREQQSSAFYLLHYRAWELLVGCILAAVVHCRKQPRLLKQKSNEGSLNAWNWESVASGSRPYWKKYTDVFATVGMLMVLIPYWMMSSSTPFPGVAALPSVLGTALLIRYGQSGMIGRALTWRPMVSVGLISYSLYLWHWPVTVFWKYAVYDQLYAWDYIGMFVLSFLLAYLSWRFVEVPIRISPTWTMRKSFGFAGAGIMLLVFIGAASAFSRGWPTILHPQANKLTAEINIQTPSSLESGFLKVTRWIQSLLNRDFSKEDEMRWRLLAGLPGTFRLGQGTQPQVVLIGDSHAGVLGAGLDAWLRENNRTGLLFTQSATAMFDLSLPQTRKAMLELDKLPSVTKVILAQGWYIYFGLKDPETYFQKLEEFAHEMNRRGKALYITADVPLFNGTDIGARSAIISPREMKVGWDGTLTRQQHNKAQGRFNARLIDICNRTNSVFIPLHLAFLQGNRYVAFEEHDDKKIALYRNVDHISIAGSIRAIRFLMPLVFTASSGGTSDPDILLAR